MCQMLSIHTGLMLDLCLSLNVRCGKTTVAECFLGCELVEWLQQVGLAQDPGEAVLYGKRLQQGGVLQHIKEEHDFLDSPLYYRFMTWDHTQLTRRLWRIFTSQTGVMQKVCTKGMFSVFISQAAELGSGTRSGSRNSSVPWRQGWGGGLLLVTSCFSLLSHDCGRGVSKGFQRMQTWIFTFVSDVIET